MRVLHAPMQIAGFGSLMARELRGLGFDAESWSPAPDYLGWARGGETLFWSIGAVQ